MLTNRYLNGAIPEGSRASHGKFLKSDYLTPQLLKSIEGLNAIAAGRNQSLAEMAISWLLRDDTVTSVIVGASSKEQLATTLKSLDNTTFTPDQLTAIDRLTSPLSPSI